MSLREAVATDSQLGRPADFWRSAPDGLRNRQPGGWRSFSNSRCPSRGFQERERAKWLGHDIYCLVVWWRFYQWLKQWPRVMAQYMAGCSTPREPHHWRGLLLTYRAVASPGKRGKPA